MALDCSRIFDKVFWLLTTKAANIVFSVKTNKQKPGSKNKDLVLPSLPSPQIRL